MAAEGLRDTESAQDGLKDFNMDYQLKLWEHTMKKHSKVENAIAVAGFKAALLVGKKQSLLDDILTF